MKTLESLAQQLFDRNNKLEPQALQRLQEQFGLKAALSQKASSQVDKLQLVYEVDAATVPTVLEQYCTRFVLSLFAASGHAVTIVVYDESWHRSQKTPLPFTFADNLVAALQEISPQNSKLYFASDLRKNATIDMLYNGLDAIALQELIGSGKGTDKKNSSRSMERILRHGFSSMVWQHFNVDVVVRLSAYDSVQLSSETAFLTIPQHTNYVDTVSGPAQTEQYLFSASMNIPDQHLLEACKYMLTITASEQIFITQMLNTRPLETKKQIATAVAALWAGNLEAGLQAQSSFEETINGQRGYRDVILYPDTILFDVIAATGLYSRSELRRLFASGAIRNIANPTESLTPEHRTLGHGDSIRIGKKYRLRMQVP